MSVSTETETVIKRILPYLRRRGYEPETDIDFETAVPNQARYSLGYVDLLVTCGNVRPQFVIEAKRNGKRLTKTDAKQAVEYGKATKATFVVVTNGLLVQVYNTNTGEPVRWNGELADRVPSKDQLGDVVRYLRAHKDAVDVPLGTGNASLPFRPALPLKQLNDLFSRCHNRIRNIEKNEEHAFADFSKILFLKLLEEKADGGSFTLPYSYTFWELAERPDAQSDQVKSAVTEMLGKIKAREYGDVLAEELHLKNPATFQYLVHELSRVSFSDSDYDVKGTAFEYFVRATLKGRKLGQYFTPRDVIKIMVDLVGGAAVVSALRSGTEVRVADPACGTGGFLVYMLKDAIQQLDELLSKRQIVRANRDALAERLKRDVFHGADANEGVASAAKMNMIIAGDGHNNITCANSLSPDAGLWPLSAEPTFDFILTNPPFGTSESGALSRAAARQYPVSGGRGQHLFLQRMVLATKPGGLICTVIDEGLLNTDTASELRTWILQSVELLAVVQLPDDTFKPNKINVRSSILLMRRREVSDMDLLESYPVAIGVIESLGYYGSGLPIRNFDFGAVRKDVAESFLNRSAGSERQGAYWRAFDLPAGDLIADGTKRWDRKYWEPAVRARAATLLTSGEPTIEALNTITTRRGKSPAPSGYVDEPEGYALVIKAGSCITKFGELTTAGADYIEKALYDEVLNDVKLQRGDVLVASTGDGTLGKACVFDSDAPALADGHVTIIRPDLTRVDPHYLADYLRCGFGQEQIQRLYTGSTGLIELSPDHVNRIVVALLSGTDEQRSLSDALRSSESEYRTRLGDADRTLTQARTVFVTDSTEHQPGRSTATV